MSSILFKTTTVCIRLDLFSFDFREVCGPYHLQGLCQGVGGGGGRELSCKRALLVIQWKRNRGFNSRLRQHAQQSLRTWKKKKKHLKEAHVYLSTTESLTVGDMEITHRCGTMVRD